LDFKGKIVPFASSVFLHLILVLSGLCLVFSAAGWTWIWPSPFFFFPSCAAAGRSLVFNVFSARRPVLQLRALDFCRLYSAVGRQSPVGP
jgi:ABC-type phosphate transport system auxiliary subunit